jgi:FixJ family two-component response regulator
VYVVSSDFTKIKRFTEFFFSHGVAVVAYRSAAGYMSAKRDDQVACVVLDLELPDISGLNFQRKLAEAGGPPVIFVTEPGDAASCIRAVKNGAIDVLIEPVDYNELLIAVEIAFAQDQKCRAEHIEQMSLLTRWHSLTPRETEVFHHTVAGLLNKQAAAELGVAENTYQVHRGRVMRKMKANSLADLVRMSTRLEPIIQERSRPERFSMRLPQFILEEQDRMENIGRRSSLFQSELEDSALQSRGIQRDLIHVA